MRARAIVLAVVVALTGCGGEGPQGLSLTGEGLTQAAPVPLDADLATVSAGDDAEGCVTAVKVAPGGTSEDGATRWFLTFELRDIPVDEAGLIDALAADACPAQRRELLTAVVERLGAVGPDALDVSYRDPDGRRWLLP